jgi:hypothetical protein
VMKSICSARIPNNKLRSADEGATACSPDLMLLYCHSQHNNITVRREPTRTAICRGMNVLQPTDFCEVPNIPLVAKVVCKKRADTDVGGLFRRAPSN